LTWPLHGIRPDHLGCFRLSHPASLTGIQYASVGETEMAEPGTRHETFEALELIGFQ